MRTHACVHFPVYHAKSIDILQKILQYIVFLLQNLSTCLLDNICQSKHFNEFATVLS